MTNDIKFRTPFYNPDGTFSHFSTWGYIDHKGSTSSDCFTPPTMNTNCYKNMDEQFTRLKDKNGKDIYQGDIISFMDDEDKRGRVLVEWESEDCKFHCIEINNNRYGGYMSEFDSKEIEVIGNIHENPELLK